MRIRRAHPQDTGAYASSSATFRLTSPALGKFSQTTSAQGSYLLPTAVCAFTSISLAPRAPAPRAVHSRCEAQ